MKILLQVNGEKPDIVGIETKMFDSEYEIILMIDSENLEKLESVLSRVVKTSSDIFNYSINEL